MLEPAGSEQPFPRAFLRIGGASLAQHQLGLALALGCQRVVCIARGQAPELVALQHSAEHAGIRFHVVAGAQQLSALVTATDELIVITEGLFAEPARVAPLLEGSRPVVLALPDDGAVAEGFERLDINNAAAGVMRIPGSLVERLHELPADFDATSALTRIALQAGAQMVQVPAEARGGAGWRMVRSDAEALVTEGEWLRARLVIGRTAAPAERIARTGVLAFGSSLLHAGHASTVTALAAMLALALGLAIAWLGSPGLALANAAFAWVLVRATELLRRAERHAHSVEAPAIPRADALGWIVDIAIIVICVLGTAAAPGLPPIGPEHRIFAPFMLILLVHLVPRLLNDGLAAWTGDRLVLAVLLALAAAMDQLGAAIRVLAVVLALAAIVLPPRRST